MKLKKFKLGTNTFLKVKYCLTLACLFELLKYFDLCLQFIELIHCLYVTDFPFPLLDCLPCWGFVVAGILLF